MAEATASRLTQSERAAMIAALGTDPRLALAAVLAKLNVKPSPRLIRRLMKAYGHG